MALLVDDLCLNDGASYLLSLDLSVVFDIADHVILIRCLGAEVGIKGCALELFK